MKTKKISWLLSLVGFLYLGLLAFPQVLFGNSLEHNEFKVYYHDDDLDTKALKEVLDQSSSLLQRSDLYIKDHNHKIFLTNSTSEFTFFALMSRKAFAVNYPFTQNIFMATSDVTRDRVERNAREHNVRSLSAVIAHESCHSLLSEYLGVWKYRSLPSWKNEGYCDFIANESSFDEIEGRRILCEGKITSEDPSFKYFKHRMTVQFLLIDKEISTKKFLLDTYEPKDLESEMILSLCN